MDVNCSMIIRDLDPITARILCNADFEDAIALGEWRFLIALLDRAVKDLKERDVCARNSARAWFSYRGPAVLGFQEVCDFIGVDADWVRAVVWNDGSTLKSIERLAA